MEYKKQLESIMSDESNVKKIVHAAGAVIMRVGDNNRTEVLLIKRAADDHWPLHWEYPRGKCDKPPGEEIIHCLKREVKEETGLDIKPVEKIDIFEYLADGGERKTICHNYLCMLKTPNQSVKLSKEHESYKWITELGEVELMVMPEQKKTLEKVFHNDRSIVSYPHDGRTETLEEYLNYLNEVPIEVLKNMSKVGSPAANAAKDAAGSSSSFLKPGMMKVYLALMIAKLAYDFYKKNLSKFARECKGLPDIEKNICMLNAKAKAKESEIKVLKTGISKCSKDRNPEKCKQKLINKINQATSTMKLAKQRINVLNKGNR